MINKSEQLNPDLETSSTSGSKDQKWLDTLLDTTQ